MSDRLANLDALARRFYFDPDALRAEQERGGDFDDSAQEDLAPYLTGERVIGAWAAVTRAGDFFYIVPDFDRVEDARARAVEHLGDDIYPEEPVCVVSLDNGAELVPDFDRVPWTMRRARLGNGDGANQTTGGE